MKALKSKTPYMIFLAILFCIAATDSFLWSQKVKPLTVIVDAKVKTDDSTEVEEIAEPAIISLIKFSFTDGKD
ncbi:hypothetical protein [Rhodohalobacter sp. 8-1]|uniref:hypothetical protein n=1 Tax=Rhodohalobacter sp. 8-1 TaxID=3131972 RepID=UPI0030ED68BF